MQQHHGSPSIRSINTVYIGENVQRRRGRRRGHHGRKGPDCLRLFEKEIYQKREQNAVRTSRGTEGRGVDRRHAANSIKVHKPGYRRARGGQEARCQQHQSPQAGVQKGEGWTGGTLPTASKSSSYGRHQPSPYPPRPAPCWLTCTTLLLHVAGEQLDGDVRRHDLPPPDEHLHAVCRARPRAHQLRHQLAHNHPLDRQSHLNTQSPQYRVISIHSHLNAIIPTHLSKTPNPKVTSIPTILYH
jgi:hypothetical protein